MAVKRVREKAQRARAKSAMQWAEGRRHHPAHRHEIEAIMAEIDLRQDFIALREAAGLTQAGLAKLIGVTQSVIARFETVPARNLELKTLVKLATALGARLKITVEKDASAKRRRTRAIA
jgi:ribosome-binding protein aMBF1 (putative translation factor)